MSATLNLTALYANGDPFENAVESVPAPKQPSRRQTIIAGIYAIAPKLWPFSPEKQGEEKKTQLKAYIERFCGRKIEKFSTATEEQLQDVFMRMKNLESQKAIEDMGTAIGDEAAGSGESVPVASDEEEVNLEEIPF